MIPLAMDFLPWRRALPPVEPPLGDLVTLLFPPARREDDVKSDDGPGPDPVVFGRYPRARGAGWG